MATWTLETAKNKLSEVIRRAIAHEPQIVTRGGRDAVVILAKSDYEKLVAPEGLVAFMRASPLAQAVASGELPERAFDRRRDMGRDVEL